MLRSLKRIQKNVPTCLKPSGLRARARVAGLSNRNHCKTPVANNSEVEQPASCAKIFKFTL